MNFCMISYSFYEIDYRVRRYAEALVASEADVDVLSLRKDGAERHDMLNGVHLHRLQKRVYNEKGPLTFLIRILLFFVRAMTTVSVRHFRQHYRVIHVHNVPDFLVFTCLIPKLLGARIVLDIHDILPEFYCQKFGIRPDSFPAKILRLAEYLSVHFADHVIVANELWRRKIIARTGLSPERCTALLNYPDEVFFHVDRQPGNPADDFRIVYPGTISHLHGLDIAVRAMAILRQAVPHARLEVYSNRTGNSPYFDQLNALVQELNLQGHVSFNDAIPHQEMAQLLRKAHVGVVPKRAGVFASEAFSTKIFEFLASGVPVVASRTRIDEFYFDEQVVSFFEPESEEELAQRLLELFRDCKKRKGFSMTGREFMRDKRWEEKKQIYYSIVEKLIGVPLCEREDASQYRAA